MYMLDKNMTPKEIISELQETYKEECLSANQIYFWIREIKCGRENLEDLPKSGRPVDSELTNTIQRAHTINKTASPRQLAKIIHSSPSTVWRHM